MEFHTSDSPFVSQAEIQSKKGVTFMHCQLCFVRYTVPKDDAGRKRFQGKPCVGCGATHDNIVSDGDTPQTDEKTSKKKTK